MILLTIMDQAKKPAKFCILYEKYKYLLQKVAMDILHDSYLAEDAVQNAFIKIADNMEKVREIESRQTKSYIIAITKNAAIDIWRKRNRQKESEFRANDAEGDKMSVVYMETDMENEVLDVIKNLPEKYRDIFFMKYSVGMENSEIAQVCSIKEGTVRQRIARGKVLIEKELKNLGVNVYAADRSD